MEYSFRYLKSESTGPVIIYISNDGFGESGNNINRLVEQCAGVPFTFIELVVNDWDRYLTPWEADANMKGRLFKGEAVSLLQFLECSVIPPIKENNPEAKIYLAGYSLAGLFSLWCMYESSQPDGAACCSGSVWYPGWEEYVRNHSVRSNCNIYLSLGNREKNTRHPLIKTVEDNMTLQYELLKKDVRVENLTFDLNEGGHFNNTEERIRKGIEWLLDKESI